MKVTLRMSWKMTMFRENLVSELLRWHREDVRKAQRQPLRQISKMEKISKHQTSQLWMIVRYTYSYLSLLSERHPPTTEGGKYGDPQKDIIQKGRPLIKSLLSEVRKPWSRGGRRSWTERRISKVLSKAHSNSQRLKQHGYGLHRSYQVLCLYIL